MLDSLKTTSIIIDDPGVSITKSFDGDMVFRDAFIPGIKLKELAGISGGSLILDPALIVVIETSDYTYIPSEELYAVDVPHNFGFTGSDLAGVLIDIYDPSFIKIGVDTLKSKTNSVYLKVVKPDNLYMVIKRVV
jgi:hypothetical protein